MIGLRWLFQKYLNRHDPALKIGEPVVKFFGYDQVKAVAGFHRSRRQSDTGRKYPARVKPKVSGTVVPMPARKVGR